MAKFKVGDKVKFKNGGGRIPEYYTDENSEIPEHLIRNGNVFIDEEVYQRDFAKIDVVYEIGTPIKNVYYIVSYTDRNKKKVSLGFREDVLELANQTKFKIGDKVKVISKTVPEYNKFTTHMKQNDIGYINKIYGDPYNFNDENNCFIISQSKGDGGDFFALKDLKLVEEGIVIGTKVKISVPRNHPEWKYDGKICNITKVSYFWDDPKTTKDLYMVDLEEKKFTREELEVV